MRWFQCYYPYSYSYSYLDWYIINKNKYVWVNWTSNYWVEITQRESILPCCSSTSSIKYKCLITQLIRSVFFFSINFITPRNPCEPQHQHRCGTKKAWLCCCDEQCGQERVDLENGGVDRAFVLFRIFRTKERRAKPCSGEPSFVLPALLHLYRGRGGPLGEATAK